MQQPPAPPPPRPPTGDAAPFGEADREEDAAPSRPLTKLCDQCQEEHSKYRCPACDWRTCSNECVAAHKAATGCSGKRARAEFVAPLNSFTDSLLTRDFGLLEEIDFIVDGANRQLQRDDEDGPSNPRSRHRARIALARACAAPERKIELVMAPSGMDIAKCNSSKVVLDAASKEKIRLVTKANKGKGKDKGKDKGKGKGKGKDKGKDKGKGPGKALGKAGEIAAIEAAAQSIIKWRVEWHFPRVGQVLVHGSMAETTILGESLAHMLDSDMFQGRAIKHLLMPYATAGVENLEVYLALSRRASVALASGGNAASHTGPVDSDDEDEIARGHNGPNRSEDGTDRRPRTRSRSPRRVQPVPNHDDEGTEEEDDDDDDADGKLLGATLDENIGEAAGDIPEEGLAGHRPFVKLDKALSLQDNLVNRAIVEFPVLHIALPGEMLRG